MKHCDLHTHTLPSIDDGAKSVEESVKLLRGLKEQGVECVCFTPHYYSHMVPAKEFLRKRKVAFESLKDSIPQGIEVRLGAEVFVTDYLFSQENVLNKLCYGKSNYMLTEFAYSSDFEDGSYTNLLKLKQKGITPVFAHIERYPKLMKNHDKIVDMVNMGILFQTNAVSYCEIGTRKKLLRLVDEGLVHIVATDVHSEKRNSYKYYGAAVKYIEKKLGRAAVERLCQNSEEIFSKT